ncbi:hypothetical protein F4813DRAFT_382971 [Daldinia decipiens]|uniref:uncharacterized protein n=1 Tax=Daldinia decipiens TaxID=326647 RepID=UPI0020C4A1D9|nr:uncharacterized protein F4813DRAFT_382971 [Daldinia decipiens]KAI1653821.1 hypothetical protein F4813DRAFT_382971 [Daldinia decipiens]
MTTTRSGAKVEPTSKNKNGAGVGSKHQLNTKALPGSKRTKNVGDKKQQTIEIPFQVSPAEAYGGGTSQPPANENNIDGKNEAIQEEMGQRGSAEQVGAREGVVPSNILEKGIVYFFIRGRVGIDEPSSIGDIRRSYIILRPLAKDAKLGEGTIDDAGNSRLIAIPKKVLPLSGKDRWIAFVEKSHTSFETLKDEFISASDYNTKTAGVRHTPAATPVAEGIYAITSTGRESHLAYMVTLPDDLGEVQKEIGLMEKGSFIISTRNPQYEPPKGTALPRASEYSKELQDRFRALRWIATQPKHLDYVDTQVLLIGESSGIQKATEPQKGRKDGQEDPSLPGDDSAAIFGDLHVRAQDYPKLQTTF